MRTVIIISLGVILALAFLAVGRARPSIGVKRAALAFIALWSLAMIANMGVGISHGYSFSEELPILLMNIIPGAVVAWGGVQFAGGR